VNMLDRCCPLTNRVKYNFGYVEYANKASEWLVLSTQSVKFSLRYRRQANV